MIRSIQKILRQGPEIQPTAAAMRRLEDPVWRRANGKWRWISWLSFGLYAGPLLIVQGHRAKSKRLMLSGYVATALLIPFFIATPEASAAATETASISLVFITVPAIAIGLWATSSFGKDVWVWKSMRDQVTADWFTQNFGDSVKPAAQEVIEPKMTQSTAEIIRDAGLISTAAQSSFSGVIEINKAPRQELEDTRLFSTEQLQKILDRREKRPIRNQDELRLLLDLRPHELMAVSKHIAYHKEPSSAAGSGRVLDL